MTTRPLPERIVTDRLVLRPYADADIPAVVAACSDALTQRYLTTLPSPYTEQSAIEFIEVTCPATVAAGGRNWVGVGPTGAVALGIGLHPPTRFGVMEAGYWAAPAARGQGLVAEALVAVSTAGFATGAPRIELVADVENAASQQVALKAGYRREGVQRSAVIDRGGGSRDMVLWARLPGDPLGPTPRRLPHLRQLDGAGVRLRPVAASDLQDLLACFNSPDRRAAGVPADQWPVAGVEHWCRTAAAEWLAGAEARFAIVGPVADHAAGVVRLRTLPGGSAELGWALEERWRGRGLARRAVSEVARWALGPAGFHRLDALVDVANGPSHRVAEAVGFRAEGVQRAWLATSAGRRDAVRYGLLAAELA
jgi:RimJ/RimL family protein N-acetyltransferase